MPRNPTRAIRLDGSGSRSLGGIGRLFDFSNNTLQKLGNDLSRIALEEPVSLVQAAGGHVIGIHVDDGHSRALCPRSVDVAGSGIYLRARADDHNKIYLVTLLRPSLDVIQDLVGQTLAEPDDSGAQQAALALGAFWQVAVVELGEVDVLIGNVEFAALEGLGGGGVGLVGGDGEGGDDGVSVVVLLGVVAEEVGALDVEERAVQQLQLVFGVLGARREACGRAV